MATFTDNIKNAMKKVGTLAGAGVDLALAKAKRAIKSEISSGVFTRKAIITDADFVSSPSIYQEKGSFVSFDVLRQLSEKDMIVAATINKLTNRIAAFASPQKDKYSLGFVIKPNLEADGSNDEERVGQKNPEQQREIAKIIKFLTNTGDEDNDNRPEDERFDFETFLRLIVNDRLVYNQIGIECMPTADNKSICWFSPVSGGSLRLVHSRSLPDTSDMRGIVQDTSMGGDADQEHRARVKANQETVPSEVMYAQVYRGQIVAVFTSQELIYKQGIPSVDLAHRGYSPGELELLVNAVSNHRIAELHNERFFTFGYGSNGILNIKASLSEEDLQSIKRQFQRQYQGVRNAFKMPIIATENGIEFVSTGSSNRDMEWSFWMEYLIKIITGVFGISPSEINFDISRGSGPSLSDSGKHNEVVLRDTRNSVLRPLLRWIAAIINQKILPRYDAELAKKYEFEFVGLDFEDIDAQLTRIKSKITTYLTVNEVREEEGRKSLGKYGEIILDPTYLQHKTALDQAGNQDSGLGGSPVPNVDEQIDQAIDGMFGDQPAEDNQASGPDEPQIDRDTELSNTMASQRDMFKSSPSLVKVEYWSNRDK